MTLAHTCTIDTEWLEIDSHDGQRFGIYVARPPRASVGGAGPGLLLLQEIFGVNEHIRAVAAQYALHGFTVYAPDIFWRQAPRFDVGYGPEDAAQARALLAQLDMALTLQDLACAASALRKAVGPERKIASLGYCLGGRLAYLTAAQGLVDAAVSYYGGGIHAVLERPLNVPVLLHFAEQDHLIPPEAVAAVQAALGANPQVQIHTYPGADHGFNCWARAMYQQRTALLAHGRTLEFLARTVA